MTKTLMVIFAATALLSGCTATEISIPPTTTTPPANDDGMTAVMFNLAPDLPVATTRATDENKMSDIQLLLIGADGTRYYHALGQKASLSARIKRGKYNVYALANCSTVIRDCSESELLKLASAYKPGDSRLAMSFTGTADFTTGSTNPYTARLSRTVAKLRFNVKTAANVKIKRVTLCNVSQQTGLFPQGDWLSTYNNMPAEVVGGEFTVYVPENLAGTVASITDQTQRTAASAPAKATYLLIEGEVFHSSSLSDKGTMNRKYFESIVYLGGNVTDDFNIRRNTDYRIDINIASDLTKDCRIELSRVSYDSNMRLTHDGKYLWYERIRFTLHYDQGEKGYGAEKVAYKFLFEGFTPGKMKIDGKYLSGNTVTGTIASGRSGVIDFGYDDTAFYTPENHLIKFTLTFTDDYGGTTVYPGELRFCNITNVSVCPNIGVKKADIKITAPDATIEECEPVTTYDYIVYHVLPSVTMTITPRPGYTFKGWYSDPDCSEKKLISTSPTLIQKPNYKRTHVYAKVE
jgi:uncharacterized repeat protein (TIGR02543 family)